MFQVLVESGAPRTARGSWTALSAIGHAALVAGAVALTMRPPESTRQEILPEIVHYAATPPAPRETRSAPTSLEFAVPMAVDRLSFTIPMVIPPATTTLSDRFTRVTDELRHVTGGSSTGDRPGALASGDVHTAAQVDRIVQPFDGNPSPAYPRRLASAGITGDVLVRFVVDTTGRVEAASIEIVGASHSLFGEAVKAWLRQTRYSPALSGNRAVRQLVQQRVGFNLER